MTLPDPTKPTPGSDRDMSSSQLGRTVITADVSRSQQKPNARGSATQFLADTEPIGASDISNMANAQASQTLKRLSAPQVRTVPAAVPVPGTRVAADGTSCAETVSRSRFGLDGLVTVTGMDPKTVGNFYQNADIGIGEQSKTAARRGADRSAEVAAPATPGVTLPSMTPTSSSPQGIA